MRLLSIRHALPALLLALAACDGGTEPPEPAGGNYSAVLQSPNGAEAAAHLELTGAGIEDVRSTGAAYLASSVVNGGRRVVIVPSQPGTVEFHVRMAQGQQPPSVRVLEVAAPDDQPRASLAGYQVNFSRVAVQ
ncbi:MAG TPA: hypothetical protein VK358_07180 [Longimicrobium sp.]|nr:hypothetical protein [Longimicrobium sp.]